MHHYHECGCEVQGGCDLLEKKGARIQRTREELCKIMGRFAHPDALTGLFADSLAQQLAQKHQHEAQKHLAHILDLLNEEMGAIGKE